MTFLMVMIKSRVTWQWRYIMNNLCLSAVLECGDILRKPLLPSSGPSTPPPEIILNGISFTIIQHLIFCLHIKTYLET